MPKILALALDSRALVDPVMEPWTKMAKNAELVDNAQAEYLVNYNLFHEGPYKELVGEYVVETKEMLSQQLYEFIFLWELHNRPDLIASHEVQPALAESYKLVRAFEVPVYFLSFRDRNRFGREGIKMLVFVPRSGDPVEPNSD